MEVVINIIVNNKCIICFVSCSVFLTSFACRDFLSVVATVCLSTVAIHSL